MKNISEISAKALELFYVICDDFDGEVYSADLPEVLLAQELEKAGWVEIVEEDGDSKITMTDFGYEESR